MTATAIVSPYLTTKEAVAYTHTSAKTLRRAELSGQLEAYRPGREKLYLIADLDRWVTSNPVEAAMCETLVHPKLSDLLATTLDPTLA